MSINGAEICESNNVTQYANWASGTHTAFAGASLGKTALGQKNFGVEYRRYDQPILRSTSAEFFDPKAMQLQTACSIWPRRPGSGM